MIDKEYIDFVDRMMSEEKKSPEVLINRLTELAKDGKSDVNASLLLAGSMGMASETGEFSDIIKKIMFQKKPLDADNVLKLKRELGDILFYWVCACQAMNMKPDEIIQENVKKLTNRYPEGFTYERSENRTNE